MKRALKILASIIIVFVLIFGVGMFYLFRGLNEVSNIEVNEIDASTLNDGVYSGKYGAGRWSNELSVTVKDHKITKIQIVDDVTFAKPEVSDVLFNSVMEKQSTAVDAVSGATVTSKAYLKSIENALTKK